jgi:hypothetical protein
MSIEPKPASGNLVLVWIGRVLSALLVLALLFFASAKFMPPSPDTAKGLEHVGWSEKLLLALGITELVCTLMYAIPQSSVLGAILLTGYLGGAIATHVRVGDAFYFQAILGILVWLGLYLREPRLWRLVPWRS